MAHLIWVQYVCKGLEKTTLLVKELTQRLYCVTLHVYCRLQNFFKRLKNLQEYNHCLTKQFG